MRNDNDSRQSPLIIGGASGRIVPVLSTHRGLAGLTGEPIYCSSCGHLGGFVTAGMPDGVFYICGFENGCGCNCERYGPMEEMHKVPDPTGYLGV